MGEHLKPPGPELSIVTVLYNSNAVFSHNLISWLAPQAGLERVELLAVSNDQQSIALSGSAMKTLSILHKFDLIINETNVGFAAAANQAIARATSKWVLLLNPDVKMNSNSLMQILDRCTGNLLDAPRVFSISLNTRNSLYNGTHLTWFGFFSDLKLGVKGPRPLGPSGGAMLIDRELFEDLGGFNEEFFMWAEDSEFSLRLQRVGQETATLDLKLDHSGGHSLASAVDRRQKAFLLARNRLFAMRMHFTFPVFVMQIPLHLLAALTLTIGVKLVERTAIPYLRGLASGLFGKLPVSPNISSKKLGVAWRLLNLKRNFSS